MTPYIRPLTTRQAALHALCNLPRYLAVASDLVQVDLAAEETSPAVRRLLRAHAEREGFGPDATAVGVLAVVAVWKVSKTWANFYNSLL